MKTSSSKPAISTCCFIASTAATAVKAGSSRGFNDDSDGIVGSDMLIPIGDRFSVQSGFTYLIPNERNGTAGATQEAWNIGMGLVWHWDRQARKSFDNCYRPFFNVADNGSLIVDQRNGTND